ncbi:NEDD4-binding protein 2-like 2 [Carassius carassius]|uniref:NEDD4-binding protein 2-like 2 n=1 Tax=Carassius carassius TaxID=217509 RepID=UPI0028688214|nr:NEDD4-binding protein 2-like 2 [Carassius carassius]XP_059390173.1 NEDD4-binding protein 2-like 2 [Carassius carassius]
MPNVNTSESTSPPDGGNVEERNETTPQTKTLSDGVKVTPVAKSSNNQTNNRTDLAILPDRSHFNTQKDVNPDGGQLDPSSQIQTDTNVTEVTNTDNTSQTQNGRVIGELGITSTSFIGPVCRPEPVFEQELCEFYKELEEVDKVDVSADTTLVDQHDLHPSNKPKSGQPNKTVIPVVVTDHGRAYRPYPDPHERNQQNQKRWRPHEQCESDDFGRGGYPQPWYPPPPWVPLDPRVQFFPPPTSGGAIMYPPDMRPQESIFHTLHANNNIWGPWEGPPLPLNRWHEQNRGFQSHEHPGFSEEYETGQHDHEKDQYQYYNNIALVLILLRGVPGSGKSTLARELLSTGPSGVILSTDDYFFQDNRYVYDSALLGDAHDWNQKRAEQVMLEGRSPVIIDNTNVKAWEMKPYVQMALDNGYRVDFVEPDTRWKYDPAQLEKRNKHGVPRETIAKMLDGFERPVNVDIVMNSVVPRHKKKGN